MKTSSMILAVAYLLRPCVLSVRPVHSQDVITMEEGAVGTHQALKQLATTGSVLHVVAHPDDEDGALLTYCARGLGVRTMLFSITRGEGGANLIAPYFFDDLGVLRTLEHLKSAGYYGNELFYSRAADYGYSKTLDEANRQWSNGEAILADLVEVIRRERPTVILSRFRGDQRDGHGHHQMAGVLSQRAFDAAADPNMFPDQIERGLRPWQVHKLYLNNIRPDWRPEDRDAWTISIPTGQYDPVLGKSYSQIARFGLGFQRSQGISGHDGESGPRTSYYRLAKQIGTSEPAKREQSLFEGIDTSIGGLAEAVGAPGTTKLDTALVRINESIQEAVRLFDARQPEQVVSLLTNGLSQTRVLLGQLDHLDLAGDARGELKAQLGRKESEFQVAIARALGVHIECWATAIDDENPTDFNHAIAGQKLRTIVRLANRSERPVVVKNVRCEAPPTWAVEPFQRSGDELAAGEVAQWDGKLQLSADAEPTRPYWSRNSIREPLYEVGQDSQQRPATPNPSSVVATIRVDDADISIRRDVEVRVQHPEFGEVRYPLTVVPAMSVQFALSHGVIPRGQLTYGVDLIVHSAAKGPADAALRLQLPDGWTSQPRRHDLHFDKEDEEANVRFVLHVPADATEGEFPLRAVVEHAGREFSSGYQTITARDLGRMNRFREAVHVVRTADISMLGTPRVGYIMGSGDDVPQSLGMLEIQPQMLTGTELAGSDLSAFDVILVGVRAYAVRPDIRKYNARLLDYVRQGGVLIVQYQTPEFDNNYGPYPYQMGRWPEEVSEEDATVTILEPDHPLFTTPNRITSADFEGWLEQRGSKFWTTWDERYVPLLECHDTGQEPQRGGMLIARHGQGVYVYSAYAWYRQLPHGVTGAFRLFANMLSLPRSLAGAPSD